jgi:hypothetical protein
VSKLLVTEFHLLVIDRVESRLVLVAVIGALFDFDDLGRFDHLETVAARGEQDDIARRQDSAFKIVSSVGIEVDSHFSAFDEKHFLSPYDLTFDGVMNVGFNFVSCGPVHVSQLLRENAGREELDPIRMEVGADDDGNRLVEMPHVFDGHVVHLGRCKFKMVMRTQITSNVNGDTDVASKTAVSKQTNAVPF